MSKSKSKHRLLILHGLLEYGLEYPDLMNRLDPDQKWEWAVMDRRGHGKSEGKWNVVDPETDVKDLEDFLNYLKWESGSFVALCHSFGGLLGLYAAKKNPHLFKGMVLSSPFLGMPENRSIWEVLFLLILSYVAPAWPIHEPVPVRQLTHNSERVNQYLTDPLIKNWIPLRTVRKIYGMQREVSQMKKLEFPILVLLAEKDVVVSKEAILKWFDQVQAESKIKTEYQNLFHELFNEVENSAVLAQTREFLNRLNSRKN